MGSCCTKTKKKNLSADQDEVQSQTTKAITLENNTVKETGPVVKYKGKQLAHVPDTSSFLPLSNESLGAIRQWWNGEKSVEECIKILDANGFGKQLDSLLLKGVRYLVSPEVSAVGGSVLLRIAEYFGYESVSGMLCHWIFNLSKKTALENAYEFLSVSAEYSDKKIKSRYRKLTKKYHPDKGFGCNILWLSSWKPERQLKRH